MLAKATANLRPYAPTILRILVGVVFLAHGWQKLQGIDGVVGYFGSLGIPAAFVMTWVVTLIETIGGLALIFGLGTRYAAALLAIEMIVTTLLVKVNVGLIAPRGGGAGAELDLALLAGCVALLLLGSGALSVEDTVLKREL